MTNEEKLSRYAVWMQQAFFDLDAAKISLDNGFHEWAAYQAEQAAEKALKSVVVHAGWRPPKMHKLGMLFGICNSANAKFRETKFSFKHLESFTFISRYPFLLPGKNKSPHDLIAHKDALNAINEAKDVVEKVQAILSGAPVIQSTMIPEEMTFTPEEVKERITEVRDILVREFAPEKIILFGRFAREADKDVSGTMDILVVADTKLPFIQRITRAREATRGHKIIIEPLIYTPEEFGLMTKEEGEGFLESALEEGKVIYQKGK